MTNVIGIRTRQPFIPSEPDGPDVDPIEAELAAMTPEQRDLFWKGFGYCMRATAGMTPDDLADASRLVMAQDFIASLNRQRPRLTIA